MKRLLLLSLLFLGLSARAAEPIDELLPVRGLAIEAPAPGQLNDFLKFIEGDLVPAHFNLLILRVDGKYAYESHPELRDRQTLSKDDVKRIVAVCRRRGIRIVPHYNLLGHQSWAKSTGALLREYPEFDETPSVRTEDYTGWPNPEGLYCKSYCPLHPDVHKVVFDIVDELCDVFEADAFHAGLDEVFYIGEKECPRCNGRDKAELFAGEVSLLRNHLAEKGRQLFIWGDRLLDGRTTGLGEWEASYNYTWRAIDLIPKDVFICDWHYERADLTGVYFALKGLPVAECGYRNPTVCEQQIRDMVRFRKQTSRETAGNLQGYIHTVWSPFGGFYRRFETVKAGSEPEDARFNDAHALQTVIATFSNLAQ